MKVVAADEMGRIERLSYAQGASEEEFMNNAGAGVAGHVQNFIGRYHLKPNITLLCGRGNNAGDAYVAGKILLDGGFHVEALSFADYDEGSPLCQLQSRRFANAGGAITYVKSADQIAFGEAAVLVDGIFGTGFHGSVEGIFRDAIDAANRSGIPIIAIDIPSGLRICATETLFLGLPKTPCFLGDAWDVVGKIDVFDFGLPQEYVDQARHDFTLIDEAMIRAYLPRIVRTRHKYQAGYVVGLGGSPGMPGAPIMASFATLRSGAGIVRLLHPAGMEAELAAAPYEVIRQGYTNSESVLEAFERASALFIGPGMGGEQTALLEEVFARVNKPCVIDADALTSMAEHGLKPPSQAILTPHHGEMARLLGSDEALLEQAQAYAEKHNVTIILKGSPTFILHPGEKPHLCARGDPGMATAGSGDVLTGMVAAFLAQVRDPLKAAILAVQFHAIAGELASEELTAYSVAATDILEMVPAVFKEFQ